MEADSKPRFHYLTFSYVILVGGPGGHSELDGNKLSRVFGSLGPGNIAQLPNGLLVVLGDYNQLLVQPPKIMFKGARPEILYELYKNAGRMVLDPFMAHKAQAFGINFEVDVDFPDLSPEQVFERLLSRRSPKTLQMVKVALKIGNATFTLEKSVRDGNRVSANINNHFEKPLISSFDGDRLTDEVEKARIQNENTLGEVYLCLQKEHS